jgi:hypothetical protein
MVKELPISNSTSEDLPLGVRSHQYPRGVTDDRQRNYVMPAGDEWCIHAPGRHATFAIDVKDNAIVVLVGGCDIEAVSIIEHPAMERTYRPIVPLDD